MSPKNGVLVVNRNTLSLLLRQTLFKLASVMEMMKTLMIYMMKLFLLLLNHVDHPFHMYKDG